MAVRKILVLWICFFMLSLSLTAQEKLFGVISRSLHEKPKFFFTLASFNTFIDHDFAVIDGARIGLSFDDRLRFGIGYFHLANNNVVTSIIIDDVIPSYQTNGELNLSFVTLSAEYYLFNSYPWQFAVTPVNIGIGRAHYEYIRRPEMVRTDGTGETIVLYQPGIAGQYSVFRWLGVGLTTGYRTPLFRSKKQTKNLSAPTFSFDVRLSLDELYTMLFQEE